MKKSKFTEAQIVFALQQAETGVAIAEVCRKFGIGEDGCCKLAVILLAVYSL